MQILNLLLVTLLTISPVVAEENATEITTTTTVITTATTPATSIASEDPTIQTFTLPTTTTNSTEPIIINVIVESADGDDVAADMDPMDTSEVKEVDLTMQEEDNSLPNDTLVETNAGVDAAPKIVLGPKSDEDGESNGIGIMHELVFADSMENLTETSTEAQDFAKAFLKPDGVVLPTDNDDFITNVTEKVTTELPPLTFWDRGQLFVGWFSEKNPQWTILVLSVLFSLILLLVILVIRECWKARSRRHNPHSYHFTGGVTDDLYNTTSLSHRYEKVTLPNQQEVTMQLVSANNSCV